MMIGMSYIPKFRGREDMLMRHAVWITPEGKAVCLTKANYEEFGGTDKTVLNSKGELCVELFPTSIYSKKDVEEMIKGGSKAYDWHINAAYLLRTKRFGLCKGMTGEQLKPMKTAPAAKELSKLTQIDQRTVLNLIRHGEFLKKVVPTQPCERLGWLGAIAA